VSLTAFDQIFLSDMSNYADAMKEIAITMEQIPSNRGYPGDLYSAAAPAELHGLSYNVSRQEYGDQEYVMMNPEGQPPDRYQVPLSDVKELWSHQDGQMKLPEPGQSSHQQVRK